MRTDPQTAADATLSVAMRPRTAEAYRLLHEGMLVCSQVEANGMRIDTDYIERTSAEITKITNGLETEMRDDRIFRLWQKKFRSKTTLGNRQQLAHILFDVEGYESKAFTSKGNKKLDVVALEDIPLPFTKIYVRWSQLLKARDTFLAGILSETVDGFLHPHINLHTTETFRSSASDPNSQNWPVRNAEVAKLIRSAFIPRGKNRHIVETDFSGIEVRVSACYHKDPRMIQYIKDPTTDMHRDMAAECYLLRTDEVNKMARYGAKNLFVFPQFYGDYYVNCARNLWNGIDRLKLEGPDGKSMKRHLKRKGITELGACDPDKEARAGTFEAHIRDVERNFWGKRFRKYDRWKKEYWQRYLETGEFRMKTGFLVRGLYRRNQVINSPVQGSAFHCLLWCLIQIQKHLNRRKMETVIIGQIHDSIIADVPADELDAYLAVVKHYTTVAVLDHWKWICVPFEIEAEVAPIGRSWHEKEAVEI